MTEISIEPLTQSNFSPFGDVIETNERKYELINENLCKKFGNLSTLKISKNDVAGFSIFESKAQNLPFELKFMERHPLASQAFMPLNGETFLITVAFDQKNNPERPRAFRTNGKQGININPNIWHGVLCPLEKDGNFLVLDRLETSNNLEIHTFSTPITINSGT